LEDIEGRKEKGEISAVLPDCNLCGRKTWLEEVYVCLEILTGQMGHF